MPLLTARGLLVDPPFEIDSAVSDVPADLDVLRSATEIPPLRKGGRWDLQRFGHFVRCEESVHAAHVCREHLAQRS